MKNNFLSQKQKILSIINKKSFTWVFENFKKVLSFLFMENSEEIHVPWEQSSCWFWNYLISQMLYVTFVLFFFFNLNWIWQGVKLRKSKKREDPNSQIDWRIQELLALWMEAITWQNIAVGGLDWDIKTNRCPGHWS